MIINSEYIQSIKKSLSQTITISGDFDKENSEQIGVALIQAIASRSNTNSVVIKEISEAVCVVLANAIMANPNIKLLMIEQQLTKPIIRKLIINCGSNINSLFFGSVDHELVEYGLELIQAKTNIITLGFRQISLTENVIQKFKQLSHIATLSINEPNIDTANLFEKYANLFTNIKTVRISKTTCQNTIKTFVRIFKERIASSDNQIKQLIESTMDELKDLEVQKIIQSQPIVNISPQSAQPMQKTDHIIMPPSTQPAALEEKPAVAPAAPKETIKPVSTPLIEITPPERTVEIPEFKITPHKKPTDHVLIDLSSSETVSSPPASPFVTPLQVLSYVNSSEEEILPSTEFEFKAVEIQQETEKSFLTQRLKEQTAILHRYDGILKKLQQITSLNKKSEIIKIDLEQKRELSSSSEEQPLTKKQKIENTKSVFPEQQKPADLATSLANLRKDNSALSKSINTSFHDMRIKVQNLPQLRIGIFKKTIKSNATVSDVTQIRTSAPTK